ncbi:MAG: hypothetical protein KBD25_03430 [Rickettsiaceae bacterium]|nr:hypothetical protein [Rickettsiaceae bacterium]
MTHTENNRNKATAITKILNDAVYLDSECYPNYYSIGFLCQGKRKYYEIRGNGSFTRQQIQEIKLILSEYVSVGFNSKEYDIPLLRVALTGVSTALIKKASDKLINKPRGTFAWKLLKDAKIPYCDTKLHIDLFEVAPGVGVSLKTYAARIGFKKIQDLPYEPDSILNDLQMEEVKEYCFNDIEVTEALTYKLAKELEVRFAFSKQYQVDLMSKSDAAIAETIFNTKYNIPYKDYPYIYNKQYINYEAPEYIKFTSSELIDLFEKIKANQYQLDGEGKLINIPYKIQIGNTLYKIGVGGMHSHEKEVHFDGRNQILAEIDVVSYYPNIMINNRYIPNNYPERFIDDYKKFYDERLVAKKTGDNIKSETCKIILNGTFGKLGSNHSSLYAPNLLLNVTITGQLTLLMLIEQLEINGISVVSANTDGIVVKTPESKEFVLKEVINRWEAECNFKTSYVAFKDIYKRSVNNYLAISVDGKVKCKGHLQHASLRCNSVDAACCSAIINFLKDNIAIEETINAMAADVRNFLLFGTSTDGAYFNDKKLGKTVRWYYSTDGIAIFKGNGNKLKDSSGANPMMEISEDLICKNIDLKRYVERCYSLLKAYGYNRLESFTS